MNERFIKEKGHWIYTNDKKEKITEELIVARMMIEKGRKIFEEMEKREP